MPWPSGQDYSETVQNPKAVFSDQELCEGRPECDRLGLPRPRSGSFATVYKILGTRRNWAVECFLNPVLDQQERYSEISAHLERVDLPYLVQFRFLVEGIRVASKAYPILKMEWVEGETLTSYIERSLGNSAALISLAERWIRMMSALSKVSIAHGDLQHGNVLIVNGELRLVDYDGMFVPGLQGRVCPERVQRNYQHPQRTEFNYDPTLDNFSSWVVYVSLVALSAQPELWRQFKGGDDCLLFRLHDFEAPEKSVIFRTLENSKDSRVQCLAGLFRTLLDLRPQDVHSLDGQSLPAPIVSSKPPTTHSWINDYVSHAKKEDKSTAATRESIPTPSPSWIQELIAPIGLIPPHQFEKTPTIERRVLGASILFLALMILLFGFGFAPASGLLIALLLISTLNYAVWYFRFSTDSSVVAMKVIARELEECGDKVEKNRTAIKSRDTDKNSIFEKHSFERNGITRQLEGARLDEQKELTALQASLQARLNSNRNQWKALNQQETVALHNISSTLGAQFGNLRHQISDLTQAESSELSRTLASQQEQFVTNYLRGCHIDSASIPGIGPGYKSRLRMAGILSAADVDYRVHSVKGFGATRSAALSAWQQPLKARALQNMAKALSLSDSIAIKDKY